jgi:hypothetical protein
MMTHYLPGSYLQVFAPYHRLDLSLLRLCQQPATVPLL